MRVVYQPRTFYLILLTQTLSMIGSSMTGYAVGIWLYTTTGDVTPLALVAFFQIMPTVLLSNIAGALADRTDRRRLMILSDFGSALATALLLISFASGAFQVWHLYGITLLIGITKVFQNPAFSASISQLMPDDQRDRANALMQLSGSASGLIAPVLTGLLYSVIGINGVIVIDLITFGIAVALLMRVAIPQPPPAAAQKTSMWADIRAGFRYLWARKPFVAMVGFAAMLNFLFGMMGVLTTPYILARTDNSEATLGIILGVTNIGALVGGIAIGVLGNKLPRMATALIALFLLSICTVLVGIAQNTLVLGIALFALNAFVMVINVPILSIFQAKVAPEMQGRVFATLTQISLLAMPIASLITGPLADNVFKPAAETASWGALAPIFGAGAAGGLGLMIAVAGGIAVIVSVIAFTQPSLRNMERDIPDAASGDADHSSSSVSSSMMV
jgi:MFS family permease